MSDVVESHLPNACRDVLERGLQNTTLGTQGVGNIVCHQLECLQLLCQSYNKKKGVIRRGSEKQSSQIQSCLEELTLDPGVRHSQLCSDIIGFPLHGGEGSLGGIQGNL